jgi:hypothetical protein
VAASGGEPEQYQDNNIKHSSFFCFNFLIHSPNRLIILLCSNDDLNIQKQVKSSELPWSTRREQRTFILLGRHVRSGI